jgi:hypothetical protein
LCFAFTGGLGLVILVFYHAVGKNWEKEVLRDKEELLSKLTGILEDDEEEKESINSTE